MFLEREADMEKSRPSPDLLPISTAFCSKADKNRRLIEAWLLGVSLFMCFVMTSRI